MSTNLAVRWIEPFPEKIACFCDENAGGTDNATSRRRRPVVHGADQVTTPKEGVPCRRP